MDCSRSVFTMHEIEESAVSLSLSESLESSVSKELSDSVPLGSWLYGAGLLHEHLCDELHRSFLYANPAHNRKCSRVWLLSVGMLDLRCSSIFLACLQRNTQCLQQKSEKVVLPSMDDPIVLYDNYQSPQFCFTVLQGPIAS